MAFYPDGLWFGNLSAPGDAERVFAHALGEPSLSTPPLQLPAAERAAHLQNIGDLAATFERTRAREGGKGSFMLRLSSLIKPSRWLGR